MTRIAIAPIPITWCPACLESWRPGMVAVKIAGVTLCGVCALEAARLVVAEQERQADDEAARRGDDSGQDAD